VLYNATGVQRGSGQVVSITQGQATANVIVDVAGMTVVAAITVEAVQELGLAAGTDVMVVIKASDVILATGN
jgi:molybdate transport system regulatory protein